MGTPKRDLENRLTKTDLVNEVAAETGFSKKDTKVFFDALINAITKALKEKRQIYIRYFGYFYPRTVKAVKLKNNFTDSIIPEHTRYCFTFTDTFIKDLKKAEKEGEK